MLLIYYAYIINVFMQIDLFDLAKLLTNDAICSLLAIIAIFKI